MRLETLTIVGVGLIGGSIGMAAKARGAAKHVCGVARSAEFLEVAVARGAIDSGTIHLEEAVARADLTILCTPVDLIVPLARRAISALRPGALLTDAGSTKGTIVRALAAFPQFVGSHPLAGSEKSGVEYAKGNLLQNRTVVVTPHAGNAEDDIDRVEQFWRSLGARTARLSAEEHDRALAFTSHLPHAVAAATASSLPPPWLPLTATGFRDTTRIAAGDPALWESIFRANRAAVMVAAETFAARFDEFRQLLASGDGPGLIRWLDEGKQVRDALGS